VVDFTKGIPRVPGLPCSRPYVIPISPEGQDSRAMTVPGGRCFKLM
jgi:hypothetical protein